MMRKSSLTLALFLVVLVPILLLGTGSGRADDRHDRHDRDHGQREGPVRLLKTVPIPGTAANTTNGNLYSYDISFVDQSTQTYYLADRSNAIVDVVDAKTGTFDRQISGGFKGVAVVNGVVQGGQSGPNGVVAAFPWLFVTDAPSRVVSIDLRTDTVVSDVSTGGADNFRADELAYDPKDGLLLVINANDTPPFGTLITVNKANGQLTVGTQISFPFATNGAEQPVWDPGTGKFYLSIPEINGNQTNQHGAVLRISTTGEVEATYPVAPQYVILDAETGNIDKNVLGVGAGDEVWFNEGDGHYYTASSGSPLVPLAITPARPPVGTATTAPVLTAQGAAILGVIDAFSKTLDQLVPTFNVPAVGTGNSPTEHPAGTAHSVAANAENNHVFVPLAANNVFPDCLTGCIAVYGRSDNDKD